MKKDYGIDWHKLDLHIDRVYEWMFRGDTTPVYVEISPTAICNHACSFCALDYANHVNVTIPKQKLLNIGNDLEKLGVRGVMFGGEGEPTLHPNLAEVITHYTARGLDTALTTNGAMLTEDFARQGGDKLKWVKISVNGGNAQTYNAIHHTSEGSYVHLWNRIREFRSACRHHIPTIGVQSVIIQDNIESLPELCATAVEEKLDYVVLKPFSPNQYSPNSKSVKLASRNQILDTITVCKKYENSVTRILARDNAIEAVSSTPGYARCLSTPFFWFYINSNAEVIACSNHMKNQKFNLGSLYSLTMQDIWYSFSQSKREELKSFMRNFDCKDCRKACRMDRINEWLWRISHPGEHKNFI